MVQLEPGDDVELAEGQGGVLVERQQGGRLCRVLLWSGTFTEVPRDSVKKMCGPPKFVVGTDGSLDGLVAGDAEERFAVGDVVEISGLASEAGQALNGHWGTVCQYLSETRRFEVSCSLGKFVKLKPGNLSKVELRPGDHVKLYGLSSAELNGKTGTIVRAVEDKCRFEVRLGPYHIVSLKPVNLQKLDSLSLSASDFHALLSSLAEAYTASALLNAQAKPLAELRAPCAAIDRVGHEAYLAALRAAQAPVFAHHGYPGGNRGADLLKAEVRHAVLSGDATAARLARELDYILGILPVGEGRGDGGDAAQAAKLRLWGRARASAWRQLGQQLAAGAELHDLEQLAVATAMRAYDAAWRQLVVLQPTLLGASPASWSCVWAQSACSAQVLETLECCGWAVVPGALEPRLAAAAGAELAELHRGGRLRSSQSPINSGAKSTWLQLAGEEERAHVRLCFPALFEAATWLCGLPEVLARRWPALRADVTVKLSVHEPGVRHKLHLDSFGGESNLRKVTCLLYINAEDYTAADGGALRLFSELAPEMSTGEAPRREPPDPHEDVVPLAGSLVLLMSRRVCHEVLPAVRDRYLMTLWVPALPEGRLETERGGEAA